MAVSEAAAAARIAVVQTDPTFGAVDANVAELSAEIEAAAADGADLVVLPELSNTGYVFSSREEAFELAEPRDGPTIEAWTAAAATHGVWLVGGFAEREGRRLYNSAAVISPAGLEGVYRKLQLWDRENLWFEPGEEGPPVFDTPFGRLGVQICNDLWFPELTRLQARKGADIVALPTNWPSDPADGERPGGWTVGVHLAVARANVNRVFFACADRCGIERGQPFEGQSVVVDPTGSPVTEVAPADEPARLRAAVDLSRARRKQLTAHSHAFHDRRTDIYRLAEEPR